MATKNQRVELEFWCAEMHKYEHRRFRLLPEAFLRPAYSGTSAECRDRTQERLHEFDYRK